MANYLAGIGTTKAINIAGGIAPGAVTGIASGRDGFSSGMAAALIFGGFNRGSKPQALHTEYAEGEANWEKPYGASSDIVFYMERADVAESPENPAETEA